MRVLVLSRSFSSHPGSRRSALDALADAVRASGVDVEVDSSELPVDDGARHVAGLVCELRSRWAAEQHEGAGPDVVHAHGRLAAVAALAAAADRGVAVVLTPTGPPGHSPLDAGLARRADALVVGSSCERERWHQAGVPVDRIHVVPPPAERHAVRRGSSGPGVVLTDCSGPALDRIIQSVPQWPTRSRLVVLTHAGEEAGRVAELADAFGVADRVAVVDPDPESGSGHGGLWQRASLVLVGPDDGRGGRLAAEGAAHAVAAISLDDGPAGDIVVPGATGVQLPPDAAAEAIGQAVKELLGDELRLRGYGLAARMRIRAMHDPACVADRAIRAYEMALASRTARASQPAVDGPCPGVAAVAKAATQDALVEQYLPVARRIARRYAGRGQSPADLVQVANLGLVKAARRFDPEQGSDFLAYAIPTMLGELRRYFRDNAWALHVPRGLQEIAMRVQRADDDLRHDLGKDATAGEVAGDLGLTTDEVLQGRLVSGVAFACRSLDAPLLDESGGGLADVLGCDDLGLERIEEREALRAAFERLPEREREILALRFFGEHTQSEIAEHLGISQMHVSRLLASTLRTLREHVVEDAPLPSAWRSRAPSAS